MNKTGVVALIGAVAAFLLPLIRWAVPGGRGTDSLTEALLTGLVLALAVAVLIAVRLKMRGGALKAGRALREKREREKAE
jgi:hypothetical protein